MTPDELLTIYDAELRQKAEITRMHREVLPGIVRYIGEDQKDAFISWCSLDPSNADQVINEQIAYFSKRVPEFEWKYYAHDQPADLSERLLRKGFIPADPGSIVVLDLENAPHTLWDGDSSLVRRVTTPGEIDEIISMENDIWNKELTRIGMGLKHDLQTTPDLVSIYGVWQDGRVVSAAWQFYMPPTRWVSLYGGSTLPGYRKRGYYTSLIAARAREARERNCRFLTVDASPQSRPILEKHGFVFLDTSIEFEWERPSL